jgi:hypothetical protein
MLKRPSARELVDAALGRKISPKGQAVIDSFKNLRDPGDPAEAAEEVEEAKAAKAAKDAQPSDNSTPPTSANPAGHGGDHHEPPQPTDEHDNSRTARKAALLKLINKKLASAKATPKAQVKPKPKPKPATRAEVNRANGQNSTGPKTAEGKTKVSANALKTGFFANVDRLTPQDSPAYLDAVEDLRMGLHPDGPVEEQLIRELAMFRARLLRLESAEYALLCTDIETNTGDARELAAGYINNGEALDGLQKAEVHLRRAYNRTWDRLERMQKERLKMPFNEALKQSQRWATYEAQRTSCPKCTAADKAADPTAHEQWKSKVPPPHPDLDENGNMKKYPAGHPLYRPKNNREDEDDPANPND